MSWEYRMVTSSFEGGQRKDFVKLELNKLGKNEWEAVGMVAPDRGSLEVTILLKRRISS